jgi:hypothetical protein
MTGTLESLAANIGSIVKTGAIRRKIFQTIIPVLLMLPRRNNFRQMSLWSGCNENTLHNWYKRDLDMVSFNRDLIGEHGTGDYITVFDPSYLPKSGKKTRIGSIRIPDSRLDFPELSKLIRNELSYESGLSRAEIIASIASSSHYNFKRIRTEFEQINNYDEMTLVSLAVNNKMIKTAPSYTNADVRYELQDYLWDFIYPEDKTMPEEWNALGTEAEKMVCKAPNWMEASYLFQMVAPVIHHPVYYNLAFLELPLSNNKIELKKNTKIDADGYYRFSYFVRKVMD